VRTAAGISSDGKTSSFDDTKKSDVPVKSYKKEDSKFIRSSLPMKNAVKMGANSLGHKKFRLVFTIFLSLIAFALFGFADTMGSYNKYVAATESIIDSGIKNASVTLGVQRSWIRGDEINSHYNRANFNEDDLALLEQKTGMKFLPVYTGGDSYGYGGAISYNGMMDSLSGIGSGSAYSDSLSGVAAPSGADLEALGFTIYGKMPATENEVAISKLTYEALNYTGFKNSAFNESVEKGALTMQDGANGILGKHLTLRFNSWTGSYEKTFTVTAVIDTLFDYDRYAAFIPSDTSASGPESEGGILDMLLVEEMQNAIGYGFHGIGYVTQATIDSLVNNGSFRAELSIGVDMNNQSFLFKPNRENLGSEGGKGDLGGVFYPVGGEQWSYHRVAGSDVLSSHIKVEYLGGRTSLGEKEYLLPLEVKNSLMNVGSVDFTEKVLAAAAEALGVEEIDVKNSGYNSLTELMICARFRKYVNENLDALKAAHRQYCADTGSEPQPDYVLTFSNFFDQFTGNGGYDLLPWYQMDEYRSLATAGLYRDFFEALSGDTFHENIPDSFFASEMSNYFQIYFESEEAKVTLESYRLADLLAEFEAADAIYGKKVDYTSDLFIDNVVTERDGELSDEQKDEWKNGLRSVEEAVGVYTYYIRSTHYYEDNGMEITENAVVEGGSMAKQLENKAAELLIKASGIKIEDVISRATLSSKVWKDGNEVETTYAGYTLAGFYSGAEPSIEVSYGLIISDGLYNEFISYATENDLSYEVSAPHIPGKYAFAIAPMPTDKEKIDTLVSLSYDEESALIFEMQNPVMDTLGSFNDFIETGAVIFMWIGVGFAVFSALMLMNFISVSISYKKREIGILRAVGAKSSDVYKIFFSESAIIALINYVLALIVTVAGTVIVNTVARNEGLNVTLLSFGIRQIILMLLISLLVAAVASFLPVYNIARKKPVDAIKDR